MKKLYILLVDDDAWLVEQFKQGLEKELNAKVAIAPNGIEAIDMIDDRHPDVIVLDMFMPGPNGMVLLHELQSHDDLAKIPVILCSNSASDVRATDLTPYGVVAMLDKSTMHPEDLIVAVKKALL